MADLPLVVAAMSGGVDSSVAAALLVKKGYRVIGIMLRLWSEEGSETDNRCCTPDSIALARRVAAILDIPFYVIDAKTTFYQTVVQAFLNGYAQGITPNPCLICNALIRWGFLLEQARNLGAERLATGHYARLVSAPDGKTHLLRGIDRSKDQSYVLGLLTQEQLSHTILPLGEMMKIQVRSLAKELNLPVADKPDSQDLCFLSGQDYRSFLGRYQPSTMIPGNIVNRQGNTLGRHQGLALYTIGQRKGIRIASSRPYYVIDKDLENNLLVVGTVEELGRRSMRVGAVNWVLGDFPPGTFRAMVQIRYKAKEADAWVTPHPDGTAEVVFDHNLRDITPGQAAIFFQNDVVAGGGIILK